MYIRHEHGLISGHKMSQNCLKFAYVASATLLFTVVVSSATENIGDEDLVIDLSGYGNRLFGIPDKSTGETLRKWQRSKGPGNTANPEELGSYIEGDILVPRKATSNGRNGMVSESYRWRDGIVPFEIMGAFDARAMDLIEQAIVAYHDNTCIKFVPRGHTDMDYISIQSGNSGCWSSVGRIGGRQVVNLQSPGCTSKVGTVMHELMHALGFLHEQNREERDQYVDIVMGNVRKGYEVNFEKAAPGSASGFGVGYDYGSVMHYSDSAFSVNGERTIVTRV